MYPSAMRRKLLFPACVLAILGGCIVGPEDKAFQTLMAREKSGQHVYKLYPGSERPSGELAILAMGDVPTANVDGLDVQNTDYQFIHLLPGSHILSWRKTFAFSVLVEPAMQKSAELAAAVDLQPGRTYRLFADRTYGSGYELYFWIEDEASGDVIGGTKKP